MNSISQFLLFTLPAALLIAAVLLLLLHRVLYPQIVTAAYRFGLPSDRFTHASGDQGAGSEDIVYFSAYYDVRHQDCFLVGAAPAALYWQVGVFDAYLRQLDRGHLNHRTVSLDEHGRFRIRLTGSTEAVGPDTLVCSSSPRGILIFRVLLPTVPVIPPDIEFETK